MEALRTPDDRFASLTGYRFAPCYLNVQTLRIHYVDEGRRRYCCCTASRHGRTSTAR
jgi:haloalkane dehalogenase